MTQWVKTKTFYSIDPRTVAPDVSRKNIESDLGQSSLETLWPASNSNPADSKTFLLVSQSVLTEAVFEAVKRSNVNKMFSEKLAEIKTQNSRFRFFKIADTLIATFSR